MQEEILLYFTAPVAKCGPQFACCMYGIMIALCVILYVLHTLLTTVMTECKLNS
jgi:hypothetical protein